jgi:hypothetical protein
MRWSGNTILQVRPPAIDHVQIRATTDSWAGTRPHSEATVNVFTTAQVPSSNSDYGAAFNVAGKAWLPLHDFDIHWRGRTTGERPLFSGDLVLNGLASRTYVPYTPLLPIGVVCCDEPRPDTRTVLLTASIDGVDKLQATVRFSDVRQADGDPDSWVEDIGHNVEVLDWRRL